MHMHWALLIMKCFMGSVNAEHLAVLAMYHDATEIITGDMPTPVKYYSEQIRRATAKLKILRGASF